MKIRQIREIENPKPVKESHTCFVSMVPAAAGGYHAAYREFTPFNHAVYRSDIYTCSARYQKYDADLRPVGDSHLLRERVEDPRAFVWRGRPYAVALDETSRGFGIYHNVILDLSTGESHDLQIQMPYQGKNWMPVPDGERLYFIRSIDPYCIVECNEKWECRALTHLPPGAEHAIGTYRGGAAAVKYGNNILGIGHRTTGPAVHTPYLFGIPGCGKVQIFELVPDGLTETILDPTSVIDEGFLLACSARQWHHQDVQIPTRLCEIIESEATE